jgi:DNA-3-methyladenine glycosylase
MLDVQRWTLDVPRPATAMNVQLPASCAQRPLPLARDFFTRDPVTCARELIGCTLVWGESAGVIVETEAYSAVGDAACHTWTRPSARAFVAANPAGAAYVYFNYGMYWMLNVLIKGGAEDGFVLFRAMEPAAGVALMARRRAAARRTSLAPLSPTALCSGPGKLAQALGVTGRDHGRDFCGDATAAFLPRTSRADVIADTRIGISRAQELRWRFVLAGSAHLSAPAATTC